MRILTTPRFTSRLIRLLFVAVLTFGVAPASKSSVFVSVAIAPPPIPFYVQPVCPGPDYIWIPGYWTWDVDDGYYWVPGYWSLAPYVGALWTPGWWGWSDRVYVWHPGYWGRHVGFYGGIDYGFGYFGNGYVGGHWQGRSFYYNAAVTNVNLTIVNNNIYRQPITQTTTSRASFNGGAGGISRQPTAEERLAERDAHRSLTSAQVRHEHLARADRGQWASVNHGTPSVTATSKVAAFVGHSGNERAAVPGAAINAYTRRQPEAQTERRETHAQAAPPIHGETRVEHRSAQSGVSPPSREAIAEHRTQPGVPPVHREARVEYRALPAGAAAPIARPEAHASVEPRREVHAQSAPRAEPHAAPIAPRPEMHAQSAPRPDVHAQVAPRPEMHAQNTPRMQGRAVPPPNETPPRGGHPEEERAGR